MLCFPNCKINLGLYVTKRRDDGYHDIETVFYPVQWRYVLEIVPASEPGFHQTGLQIAGNGADNLVWKAYQLLKSTFPGKVPGLDIYLHKIIPMGAGLGGGSADGAFMLSLLNEYCGLQLTKAQLSAFALQLGSDCPFFIYNSPQFATGRGEQMSGIAVDLSACTIQLICPRVHVSTGAAFGWITPRPAPYDLRLLSALPVADWRHHITNDFEAPVFRQHPVLAHIKQQLYEQGAIYASMSGSGSSVFGIFPKGGKANIAADIPFDSFTDGTGNM